MPETLASPKIVNPEAVKKAWAPTEPTVIFDTYWRFAVERQAIFFRRMKGSPGPVWTEDSILQAYKFTNAYRASDRVSQYLIREVIYEGDESPEELFFRIMLFKLFNKIETWEMLCRELGGVSYSQYSFKAYDNILTKAMNRKQPIYSAAYIMPSGNTAFGRKRKHRNHLKLIEMMMEDRAHDKIACSSGMAAAFDIMRSYPTIGDFLAYQFVTDINYSPLTKFTEMEFVIPGPGAKSGIKKCFNSLGGLSESEIILRVAQRQKEEFARLGLNFQSLGSWPLQLIDCQNLFCETDKYSRMAHPEANGPTGRTRIKQKFRATMEPIRYWYPPKWGINDEIEQMQRQ